MKPIKIAIIGYGKIAEDQHVPSIHANPRFELVATSSRSGQGVARTFTDWRELIRSVEGLQAVAITTPPKISPIPAAYTPASCRSSFLRSSSFASTSCVSSFVSRANNEGRLWLSRSSVVGSLSLSAMSLISPSLTAFT